MQQNNLQNLTKLLRYDIVTSTTQAGSGHPTSSLSGVELLTVLFFDGHYHYDFKNPKNLGNDRLIFSKGHASPLLYSLYHASGALSYEELMTLRKMGSRIEGHPTPDLEYVDVATGSLGQGLSIGVGMALAIKLRVKNQEISGDREPRVYVVLGDSEVAEGQIWEAMEIASHYKLNNLVGILDVNRLGQRGATLLEWDLETYRKRAEAFGWHAIVIDEGNDLAFVQKAFEDVENSVKNDKPIMIIAKTKKGAGISAVEDKDDWHGKALPKDMAEAAIKELGEVNVDLRGTVEKPQVTVKNITTNTNVSITGNYDTTKLVATREAYGKALAELGTQAPNVVALDAETSNSTFAEKIKETAAERFFEMYIAEQNMASAAVGFSKIGYIPFFSSFAAFLARAFDQIRMSQYSEANVKVVGSHAGVSIGVDGSSQMALEDLAMMRSLLTSIVLYPSDAISTLKIVEEMYQHDGISYLRLTREKTPILYKENESFPIGGSKVVREGDKAVIVAAGITLHEAIKAADQLEKDGIKVTVIDAYSVKPLDAKTIKMHAEKTGHVVVVEDHYPCGGLGEAVKVALNGMTVKIDHLAVNKIPHSGQPAELLRYAEIDAEAIVNIVKKNN